MARDKKAEGYRVLKGISWPKDGGGWHNVEPGPRLQKNLPAEHIAHWLEKGAIEPADASDGEES